MIIGKYGNNQLECPDAPYNVSDAVIADYVREQLAHFYPEVRKASFVKEVSGANTFFIFTVTGGTKA